MDISLLRCPCSRLEPLRQDGDGFACPCQTFQSALGQPVLINFDRSIIDRQSFERQGGGGFSPKRATKMRTLSPLIWGNNSRSPLMAKKFSALVDGPILVVGGGTVGNGMEHLKGDIIAFDVYPTDVTSFVADGHNIPIATGSVGGVWIQAVLEHVIDPWQVVAEIHRVLKPGGVVYADTPFMQPVHEGAYDFTRFSRNGHRWLFRRFEEIEAGASVGVGWAALLSLRHAFITLFRNRRIGSLVASLFLWLRLIDKIRPDSYAGAGGFYFLGRKSDTELHPRDMVAYYRQ